jgi:hypothetical protein
MQEKISHVRALLIIDENRIGIAHRRLVHVRPTLQSNVNAWLKSQDFQDLKSFLFVAPKNLTWF